MNELTKLEECVLKMLLDGDDEILASLRKQLHSASVTERDLSGVGFFTTLHVAHTDAARATDKSFKFGDVHADISGLECGAGFLLYVRDGVLEMLEAYTYDEQWPDDTDDFSLSYVDGQRDIEKLASHWLE